MNIYEIESDRLKSHTKLGCNMIEVKNLSRYYGDFAAISDIFPFSNMRLSDFLD